MDGDADRERDGGGEGRDGKWREIDMGSVIEIGGI